MVRKALPALLVIHTNLFAYGPAGLAGLVAVSPNTRYVLLTASWSEKRIADLLKSCEPSNVSLEVLMMPFNRVQLIAALEPACGLLA